MQLQVAEWQLGVFIEDPGYLTGLRVGDYPSSNLDQHAGDGIVHDDIQPENATEGIFVLVSQVHLARQHAPNQRRFESERADLRGFRASWRDLVEVERARPYPADLRLRTSREPITGGGIDSEALRERHRRVLQRRCRVSTRELALCKLQLEIQTRWAIRSFNRR